MGLAADLVDLTCPPASSFPLSPSCTSHFLNLVSVLIDFPSVCWPLGSNSCGFLAVTGSLLSEVQAHWSPEYAFMAMTFVLVCRLWLIWSSSIAEVDCHLIFLLQLLEAYRISWNSLMELTILSFSFIQSRGRCIFDRSALPVRFQSEEVPPIPFCRPLGFVSDASGNSIFSHSFFSKLVEMLSVCFQVNLFWPPFWILFNIRYCTFLVYYSQTFPLAFSSSDSLILFLLYQLSNMSDCVPAEHSGVAEVRVSQIGVAADATATQGFPTIVSDTVHSEAVDGADAFQLEGLADADAVLTEGAIGDTEAPAVEVAAATIIEEAVNEDAEAFAQGAAIDENLQDGIVLEDEPAVQLTDDDLTEARERAELSLLARIFWEEPRELRVVENSFLLYIGVPCICYLCGLLSHVMADCPRTDLVYDENVWAWWICGKVDPNEKEGQGPQIQPLIPAFTSNSRGRGGLPSSVAAGLSSNLNRQWTRDRQGGGTRDRGGPNVRGPRPLLALTGPPPARGARPARYPGNLGPDRTQARVVRPLQILAPEGWIAHREQRMGGIAQPGPARPQVQPASATSAAASATAGEGHPRPRSGFLGLSSAPPSHPGVSLANQLSRASSPDHLGPRPAASALLHLSRQRDAGLGSQFAPSLQAQATPQSKLIIQPLTGRSSRSTSSSGSAKRKLLSAFESADEPLVTKSAGPNAPAVGPGLQPRLSAASKPTRAYTVHSGYNIIHHGLVESPEVGPSSPMDVDAWNKLWSFPIPPKLHFFVWKCVLGVLPTRVALNARIPSFPRICPV
ncbi:hypothetical protein LINPERHAP2_LOCUS35135 [Linum perenne]